jgi:hypothetical protein
LPLPPLLVKEHSALLVFRKTFKFLNQVSIRFGGSLNHPWLKKPTTRLLLELWSIWILGKSCCNERRKVLESLAFFALDADSLCPNLFLRARSF